MEPIILLLPSVCFLFFFFFHHLYNLYDRGRGQCCYLIHYECHKPSNDRKIDTRFCGNIIARNKNLGHEDYRFLLRVIVGSGIGEETYGPRNIIACRETSPTLEDGLLEMEEFFVETLDRLFMKTGISPREIDVVVVNVASLACVPSLSSMIINRYKMRDDVNSYNLTGMGCSAGVISINIVENVFKSCKDVFALVVSSESIAPNWYTGNKKSMLLTNCLFRSGGCSILLTNKRTFKNRAKFRLKCLIRTHLGANDEAYTCCWQKEDDQGRLGFYLGKNLPKTATRAFVKNITSLAIQILPLKELLRYIVLKLVLTTKRPTLNLKTGIDRFCVHPGGTAVIEEIKKSLGLSDEDVEPSRMTLH